MDKKNAEVKLSSIGYRTSFSTDHLTNYIVEKSPWSSSSSFHHPSSPTMATSPSEYVTLVSGDGFEFILPRSTACVSGTIRRMLEPTSESPLPLSLPQSIPNQY